MPGISVLASEPTPVLEPSLLYISRYQPTATVQGSDLDLGIHQNRLPVTPSLGKPGSKIMRDTTMQRCIHGAL